ncbi:MAG: outer membrane beta-barrel protein [Candidatus Eisenbacteria bacterium]|nr:outer membrane beta-barrel protein [Candidatus Eisenbacteria bacterium]
MKRRMIFPVLMILVLAGPALAGLGIGPQVGYYKASDADEGEFLFGGALRLKPIPFLGVEGSINYRQESYYDDALKVKSWPVMVTGLVYPIPFVYGLAGAGWYNTTFEYDSQVFPGLGDEETTSEMGWHVGAGVELPLGTGARLAGDVRYVFLDYELEGTSELQSADSNFYVITVTLFFGG